MTKTTPPAPLAPDATAADPLSTPVMSTSPHIIGELMHVSSVVHMIGVALVTKGVIPLETFEHFAKQTHNGWLAMEANSEGDNPHAHAWAVARMKQFLHDIEYGIVNSPSRKSAILSLMAAGTAS